MPLPPAWCRTIECGWVEFKRGGEELRGYFAQPKRGRNVPGIVMAHENLGIIEHRQDVTRRLAMAGYAAITVDLYSRIGGRPPQDFKTPEERRAKAFLATADEQAIPDLEAGCRFLVERGTVDASRLGAMGYCMGGGTLLAWICGPATPLKAAVAFYPTVIVPGPWRADGTALSRAAIAADLTCALQVHFGDIDEAVKAPERQLLEVALGEARPPVEFCHYPDTNHAFHDDTHPNYMRHSAELAWSRSLSFLGEHLGCAVNVDDIRKN